MNILQLFYAGADDGLYSRWRRPNGHWSGEKHISGDFQRPIIATQVSGANILQLFYRSTEESLLSRWRNPDGSWSEEQDLGGAIRGGPVAAQVPGTDILQLFYRGVGDAVYSRWRNPDGSWSGEQRIGGVLNGGDPVVAQVPGTDILQLFYSGRDNGVYSRWRNGDGSWSAEQQIGGVLVGDPVVAQVPGTNILQIFYRGTDHNLYSRWRNADGTWSDEQHLGGLLGGAPIAAQVPDTNILQLFYRGTDNSIYSRWRNPDGSWSGEQHIGGALNNSDPIVAQVPGESVLQLFYRGTDDSVYSRWRNPDGSWSAEQHIGGTLRSDPIVAEIPEPTGELYTVVLMIWGAPQPPNQTTWLSTLTGPDLSDALTQIANLGYFDGLAQYNVKQVVISGVPAQLTTPAWPPGNATFTTVFAMSHIENVVKVSIANGAIASPAQFSDSTPIYVVVTPRGGLMADNPGALGEHSLFAWGDANRLMLYAYVGAQSDLNDTLVVATHEIVEALGNHGGASKELCDECGNKYGNGVEAGISNYTLASYFDEANNQCIAPPAFRKPAS